MKTWSSIYHNIYHHSNAVQKFRSALLAFDFALGGYSGEAADKWGDRDDEGEGEEGVDSFNFEADGVGHENRNCLWYTNQDEIFTVFVAHLRNYDERTVVYVLAVYPEDYKGYCYLLEWGLEEQIVEGGRFVDGKFIGWWLSFEAVGLGRSVVLLGHVVEDLSGLAEKF